MRLSIVILTYNQRAYTLRLMETLIPWLSVREDVEVILVDNGSGDGTLDAIRTLPGIPAERVKLIRNSRNIGVAPGRNVGLRQARGEYVMLLDNDTEASAHTFEGLISYLDSHPECGLAAPGLESAAGELQDSAKPFPGLALKIRHLLSKGPARAEREALASRHPFYVIGACQMFRRSLLEKAGYLDHNIFYGPEDADWCMRIRETGYSVDYLPELRLIHHWQRATRRSPLSPLSRRHIRGLIHFWLKHRRLF